MNLLCEMRFSMESKTSGKGPNEYGLLTRSYLSNRVVEASNWLGGEYGEIVNKMEVVFGEGRVRDLFGPEGSPTVGAKTKKARQFIIEAQESLSVLEIKESSTLFKESAEMVFKALCTCSRHRRSIIRKADFVFNRDRYRETKYDENIRHTEF